MISTTRLRSFVFSSRIARLGIRLLDFLYVALWKMVYTFNRLEGRGRALLGLGGGTALLEAPETRRGQRRRIRPRDKIKLVLNPIAGKGIALKVLPHLRRGFKRHGFDVEVLITERAGEARQDLWRIDRNVKAVVAVGGDGTLNEVINGVGDQRIPVALYAAGTGNCLSKEFHIPKHPGAFCEMVVRRKIQWMDVGQLTMGRLIQRRFLSFVGVGFDAHVVAELSKQRKGNIYLTAYTIPFYKVFRKYKFPPLHVEVDGVTACKKGSVVLVSNIKSYAVMTVAKHASPDDGLLDVFICKKPGRLQLIKYLWSVVTHTHSKYSDIIYLHGKRIRITSPGFDVPVQADGDPSGVLPVDIRVIPGALPFIIPEPEREGGAEGSYPPWEEGTDDRSPFPDENPPLP